MLSKELVIKKLKDKIKICEKIKKENQLKLKNKKLKNTDEITELKNMEMIVFNDFEIQLWKKFIKEIENGDFDNKLQN
ncbi:MULTISPECIES: hypothetical protein [unclassified Spiroplasma]|uniref:hypothetical protein n=1 Tax=unclassified Spiroplasma TaxID=2637901 RepID=UPI0030CC5404